jgi:uncharacterized protein (TIGR00369 family)
LREGSVGIEDENRSLVERIFRDAQFVGSLGIVLTAHGEGWCETRLAVTPSLRQQHGFIHGGVLMTLADHTCGGAAATLLPAGRDVISAEIKVSFLRPASGPGLVCRAEVLRAERNFVFVEAEVMNEAGGGRVMVAKASSTLAVIPLKKRPAEERTAPG